MDESLGRLGWIDAVIVNERTGHVLDGHDRIEEALERGSSVPLMWVDVAEEDEEFVLATFDPIAALAEWDPDRLGHLVESVDLETEALRHLLTDTLALVVGPPPLEDLGDEYDPDAVGGGSGGPDWLRLEVGEETLALWRAHRDGHASDDEALRELLG